MYRFKLMNMTHGSAGLSPEAVAKMLQVEPGSLPLDLKCPLSEMEPRADLIVYYYEAGDVMGNYGSAYALVLEKPNGVGRTLLKGGRSKLSEPNGTVCCRKFRGYSSELNWVEFTCHFPETVADPANAAAGGK